MRRFTFSNRMINMAIFLGFTGGLILILLSGCGVQTTFTKNIPELRDPPEIEQIPGPPGEPGPVGPSGAPGEDGEDGQDGVSVVYSIIPGTPCSTILMAYDINQNSLVDIDEMPSTLTVCNGADAPVSDFTVTEVLDPCGPQGSYDEVLLRMQNGQVIASFSQTAAGLNTRFTILLPNTPYQTTDGTGCNFQVDEDGNLV